MTIFELRLTSSADLYLGTGHGSGFSRASAAYVPSSTLTGAIVGRFRASMPRVVDAELESLLRRVSVSDAVVVDGRTTNVDWSAVARPLDRMLCKYPTQDCPAEGWSWWKLKGGRCPNGCAVNAAKGERQAAKVRVTRVALDASERARDDHLFQRQALDARNQDLVAWVDASAEDLEALGVSDGAVLRIGGLRSVAGRVQVTRVTPVTFESVVAREGFLRLELLTPGVYVDDYGFPSPSPSAGDLGRSLGIGNPEVVRSFVRWTTVGGWSVAASVPKPEDPAVVAHSVFLVRVPVGSEVPAVVSDLGWRTFEGNGWARVESLAPAAAEEVGAWEVNA